MKNLIEILGWYGALAILLAYTLVSFSFLDPSSIWYQLLNLTGAIGLVIISLYKHTYQLALLNIIWILIAIFAVVTILFH